MNQNNQQHIKSYNPNSKGRNRIKYSSSKQRAKKVSADVYRSYKRKTGVTGPASREERVHHPENFKDGRTGGTKGSISTVGLTESGRKKRKLSRVVSTTNIDMATENGSGYHGHSKSAIVKFESSKKEDDKDRYDPTNTYDVDEDNDDSNDGLDINTTFAMELDLARSRNGSQLFSKLYKELAPLVKSLPEILHHASKIIHLLLSYVLSPASNMNIPSSEESWAQSSSSSSPSKKRNVFVVNLVTSDVLHLLAVLARDLRQEIHPFVHDLILPRIINDLINPPTIIDADKNDGGGDEVNTYADDINDDEENNQDDFDENEDENNNRMDIHDDDGDLPKSKVKPKVQQRALDITAIEAAFRTISYIFRYDSQEIVNESNTSQHNNEETKDQKQKKDIPSSSSEEGCLELMRKHYGATLAHKQEFVRRLAAETFAPMIRKLKSNNARKKHIRRVIKSFASSAVLSIQKERENLKTEEGKNEAEASSSLSVDDIMSPRLVRARDDAIDGVAKLLFYVVRGVSGRLHSKAIAVLRIVINCLTMMDQKGSAKGKDKANKDLDQISSRQLEMHKSYMIYRVVSKFIYNIRGHVSCADNFVSVWDELYLCSTQIFKNMGDKETINGLTHIIQTVNESVCHGHGRLLRSENGNVNDENAQNLAAFLSKILKQDIFGQATTDDQRLILNTLCAAWKVYPDHISFTSRLPFYIKLVSSKSSQGDINTSGRVDPILFISSELLPYVPRDLAATVVLPSLLSAAVKRCKENESLSTIRLLHTIATCHLKLDSSDANQCRDFRDNDNLFFVEENESCKISATEQQQLIDFCLNTQSSQSNGDEMSIERKCAFMGFVIRIIPFLTLLSCEDSEDEENLPLVEKVCNWILSELKELGACHSKDHKAADKSKIVVLRSLMLEALACIVSSQKDHKGIIKLIKKSKLIAKDLLFDAPQSQLALKAVASIAQLLHSFGEEMHEDQNEVYEMLNRNLSSNSHFLRLHTLTLLNTFQQLPYVVNHDDLDLSGDLDEEVTSNGKSQKNTNVTSGGLGGKCDLIETLLQIERAEINLNSERSLAAKISRVEILGRTGQLPVFYAEAASYHMFGLMHVKYQPLWKSATRALVALAACNEVAVWTSIENNLQMVMKQSFFKDMVLSSTHDKPKNGYEHLKYHLETLLRWDLSKSSDAQLFQDQILVSQQLGRVSKHQNTDKITVFENVWKVIEGVPSLLSKKSRFIVPMFLRFLHYQYYLFHDKDPDAREFGLENHVEKKLDSISITDDEWSKENLGRKIVQKKLTSFLKTFAEVKGMQHLHKHKVLFVIFVSFLSNPDVDIAQLSLQCVTNYKYSYITPYKDQLKGILMKGLLRETLTKFDLSTSEGTVDKQDRENLFPLIIRLLFGRLTARGGAGSKSSKDSPAIRRAAILGFLTGLDSENHELDYFMYMMVRTFIPQDVNMQLVDCGHQCKEHIKLMIQKANVNEPGMMQIQRQEGFLNLISDVVKKLGFGIVDFIPVLMNLTLTFLQHSENNRKQSKIQLCSNSSTEDEHEPKQDGKIRSLCFLRISELMSKFASKFDFSQFSGKLWTCLDQALVTLPKSVVNAEKPPSLLIMLVTLSSHPNLIKFLHGEDDAIVAVFKCIAIKSRAKVVDCVITFIDNLLTEGGTIEIRSTIDRESQDAIGTNIVLKHLELLISQFTKRLEHGSSFNVQDDKPSRASKDSIVNQLLSRELSILCRVSELLVHKEMSGEKTEEITKMIESLCGLLIPFLALDQKLNESSRIDILGILYSIIPRISKAAAFSHLPSLARLLGPNKSNHGLQSILSRQMVVGCIDAISKHDEDHSIICLRKVSMSLQDLVASHPKHINECNFEKVLPVINQLASSSANDKNWLSYINSNDQDSMVNSDNDAIKTLLPLIYSCFHMLYDEDGVISRGAIKALRSLVAEAKIQISTDNSTNTCWKNLIESYIVPRLLDGIKTKNVAARRSFVLLLAEVSSQFKTEDSPHFYGDLSMLIQSEDQNLDFFLNITHIQIHRRTRALGRIRKLLTDTDSSPFSVQSLSNVLLILAMHPIYDLEKKSEELHVVESIATVGAITKHFPWGKYQNFLWKLLIELSRFHDKQERYFIALICAVIDSFPFELNNICCSDSVLEKKESILRQMRSRIIPKIESYLVQQKVEQGGTRSERLRAPIVLALVNLYQKMPSEVFELRFPRLLTVLCNGLANRDSNEREVARETLSKIAVSIDTKYLVDVIRELAISLSEGFKLHVRSATLHSILLKFSQTSTLHQEGEDMSSPFDHCVPSMVDIIQQDLFGSAEEMKVVESVRKNLVKEASGSKSFHSLELIAKKITFKPSMNRSKGETKESFSSIHLLVDPFLQRIRDPEVDNKTIGKVKECLNRIANGISQNSSVKTEEVLPFIYATVYPFLSHTEDNTDSGNESDEDDDEEMHGLEISRTSQKKPLRTVEGSKKSTNKVFEWAPSQLQRPKCTKSAFEMKMKNKKELRKVYDGFNAPKLTGSSRNEALKSHLRDFNDPATSSAVSFALTLLHSHIKKSKLVGREAMIDPFVKILTQCVRYSKDSSAILLALKCLQVILRFDLPSTQHYRKVLARHVLQLLSLSANNTQDETVQCCFKTMTLLIAKSTKEAIRYLDDSNIEFNPEKATVKSPDQYSLPLTKGQMQVLISLLQSSTLDSEQNNATFSVIKAIASTRFISNEFYTMMENVLKMTVQSQQQSVRQQSAKIFLLYFIEYPMGTQRLEHHLKQMVLNIKYEYESGRKSALELILAVIQKLPIPLLEEHTRIFFLPLVLQLVNDESKLCREAVSSCIVALLMRLSTNILQSLHEYLLRWSTSSGIEGRQLRQASIQLFGLFMDARIDFMKKGGRVEKFFALVQDILNKEIASSQSFTSVLNGKEWELSYFCLQAVEKVCVHTPLIARKDIHLWEDIIKCLVHPHPWIQLIASRVIHDQFSSESVKAVELLEREKSTVASTIFYRLKGSLFDIVRNICFQINSDDDHKRDELLTLAIKNLTWTIKMMDGCPSLCYKDETDQTLAVDENYDETDEDNEVASVENTDLKSRNPVTWLITRLSNMAKQRGTARRETIFKCFAAFVSVSKVEINEHHLELMLEPMNRVISEVAFREESKQINNSNRIQDLSESNLPKEVMQILEDTCGTELFMNALARIQTKSREKRESRKQLRAAEAIHDPETAARRKVWKHTKDKQRKKRRVEERRVNRGVFTKKPRHIVK